MPPSIVTRVMWALPFIAASITAEIITPVRNVLAVDPVRIIAPINGSVPTSAEDTRITPFWGDSTCFPGDNAVHSIGVDVSITPAAIQAFGGGDLMTAVSSIHAEFGCVNRITVPQLHVAFYIASVSTVTAECTPGDDGNIRTFEARGSAPLKHLFDYCPQFQWAGLAFVGGLCTDASQSRSVTYVSNACLTLAHEFGHSMGADHPFSSNSDAGNYGGLMDYGNTQVNGVTQFNAETTKAPICDGLTRTSRVCSGSMTAGNRYINPHTTHAHPHHDCGSNAAAAASFGAFLLFIIVAMMVWWWYPCHGAFTSSYTKSPNEGQDLLL